MGEDRHWHLVCYDVRCPKRWYRVFKILKGCGEHLQYSIFRVQLSKVRLEALRWELCKVMDRDRDDLMIVRLCPGCASRIIDSRGAEMWKEPPPRFDVI